MSWQRICRYGRRRSDTGDFDEGKHPAARYFFYYELPKASAQFDVLDSGGRITTDLDEDWF